tara:strand:+ start:1219 stop:1389 length:171 start_codon:yes stop_codon:yes gene_type:complete
MKVDITKKELELLTNVFDTAKQFAIEDGNKAYKDVEKLEAKIGKVILEKVKLNYRG